MKFPPNLATVAERLGDLRERVVFVGGVIRSLLVTDPAVAGVRPTDDVDVIVDVGRIEMIALNEDLRARGFREDTSKGAPICRWRTDDIPVDIMPVDPAIFGFTNVWYVGGIANATPVADDDESSVIRVLDAPHFCASKLEAFASRSAGDVYHHDLEDFIAVVDGRETLLAEIIAAPREVMNFLADEVSRLLGTSAVVEALPGHLGHDETSQQRLPLLLRRLRAIAELAEPAPTSAPPVSMRPILGSSRPAGTSPSERWVPLRSSNIAAVAYDGPTSTLVVEFIGGRVYEYDAVPRAVFDGFGASASAGRYHYYWVRNRYTYRRVG